MKVRLLAEQEDAEQVTFPEELMQSDRPRVQ